MFHLVGVSYIIGRENINIEYASYVQIPYYHWNDD